jgi:hypothetical protein
MQEFQAFIAVAKFLIGIFVLIIAIFTNGVIRTEVPLPIELTNDQVVNPSLSVPFSEEMTARHWLFGLVQGEQPDLKLELNKYIRQGDRVTEMTVWTRRTVIDLLLTGITLGIYTPVTVTIEGAIVRK